jgi:hypothetical protein
MRTSHAFLFGLALIAAAVFATRATPAAEAPQDAGGKFAIATAGDGSRVWRVNTQTGQVSICFAVQEGTRGVAPAEIEYRCFDWTDQGQ